jgi:hypothetical protein
MIEEYNKINIKFNIMNKTWACYIVRTTYRTTTTSGLNSYQNMLYTKVAVFWENVFLAYFGLELS